MIDVKRTTLVPSQRALEAFKDRGELDGLALEYQAERAAVAAHLGRDLEEVIVELSPSAIAIKAPELRRAAGEPEIRRRLVNIHVIHPEREPARSWRELAPDAIGISRHEDATWLWVGGMLGREVVAQTFARRRIPWAPPTSNSWPVDEATTLPVGLDLKTLLHSLGETVAVVDVDRNGRPFPTATP